MEIAIVALLFIGLVINPSMAIWSLLNIKDKIENKKTISLIKGVQVINAVIVIAVFVLVNLLFNSLALGAIICW